jgi:hypothetical protein
MSSVMRRTIPLMLAVAGGLLSACASSSRPAPKKSSVGAAPHAVAKSKPLSRRRALAFARAVNLTAADMPGFSVSSTHQTASPREKRLEGEMLHCVGPAGPSGHLADVSSKDFELKRGIVDLGVSSEVAVALTPATASAELAAIRSARVRGCFSHYLGLLFQSQRFGAGRVGSVTIAAGTPPAPGTAGGFGWRVTATLIARRLKLPFYMDVLGFIYGPTRVTLFSSGALRPFPAEAQQRLFSLLLDRAKAQAL